MNYRRIEFIDIETDIEKNNILQEIATIHNATPSIWIPNYIPTMEDIEETKERILNTLNEDLFITIAENDEKNLMGFIWAYKRTKNDVMIMSLYVKNNVRNMGIASKLKILLEEWCREEIIGYIETTVHSKNKNMILLNEKLGYVSGMITMTKKL